MPRQFQQHWPRPTDPLPIVVIGTGDIVNDAHLPAYRKAGFEVIGVFDIDTDRAVAMARNWDIEHVYAGLAEAAARGTGVIYDIATPPAATLEILSGLPDGAAVLMQKPMGENLEQAGRIRNVCRKKKLNAAVNFQLRFSPMMLAVRDAIGSGRLGEIVDMEVHINISTPWQIFPFLKAMERVEIAVHSIHYLDLFRSIAGDPQGVFARSIGDPRVPDLAQTRSSIILDYGQRLRALLSINHNHDFGRDFQTATIRFEGTKGCALVKLGLLMDYPHGEPDELWLCEAGQGWEQIELQGQWFPDAFANVMSNLQRFHAGDDAELLTCVDDAFLTMQLVESCFIANRTPPVAMEA
jgi:predicted dehydrogenase